MAIEKDEARVGRHVHLTRSIAGAPKGTKAIIESTPDTLDTITVTLLLPSRRRTQVHINDVSPG